MFVRKSRFLSFLLSSLFILSLLAASLPQPAQAAPAEIAFPVECASLYTVKPGETIYRIARNFEVKVWELARANNLTRPYYLKAGTKLCIPEEYTPPTALKLTIQAKGGKLFIEGKGFPKNHVFYVRVRPTDASQAWAKIDVIQSDNKGIISEKSLIPKTMLKNLYLTVCLKDHLTNYPYCRSVINVP